MKTTLIRKINITKILPSRFITPLPPMDAEGPTEIDETPTDAGPTGSFQSLRAALKRPQACAAGRFGSHQGYPFGRVSIGRSWQPTSLYAAKAPRV